MTSQNLIDRLAQIIRMDEKHPDYERVNKISKLYKQLVTGEDMGELLQQFTPRESTVMFEQRKRITQHITKTVSQNVMDIFYKVPRSNSVQRNISYASNDSKKLKEFNDLLIDFWGDQSLDDYMNMRWFELNFTDPNTFVVVEWGNFDNSTEHAMPYPFEVGSKEAIMYEYKNNDLLYLVAEQETESWVYDKTDKKDKKVEKETYTIYGDNQTVQFEEINDKKISDKLKQDYAIPFGQGEYIFGHTYDEETGRLLTAYFIEGLNPDDEVYYITCFKPHDLGYVPAKRIGFKRDLATNGRTFVSPLDKATPILMKMVKANSEFDLTMALHVFPQKIQYAPRCKSTDCHNGFTVDGGICNTCHGTGFEVVTTAQDFITLALPKTKDDMLELANMVYYNYPPVDLVTFQSTYIDKLTVYVKEAVFNTELFSKKEVSETATGKNISLQNVYDSLYPVASAYSKIWKFLVTTVGDVTDLSEGLVAFYHFSKDFKLKSLSDLYLDLKMVGDAKGSEFIKSSIESDIAGIIYSEDERGLLKYNVKQSFYPFSGKTPDEIKLIATGTDVTKFTKVFYANYGFIFDNVEQEQAKDGVDFYLLARDKQWEIIKAKVEEIIADVEKEAPKEPVLPKIEPKIPNQPK